MLPCAYLGCQNAAGRAFPLKSTGILSEQTMQGQLLYNTFSKAYDGSRSSMLVFISYVRVDIDCINVLQALQDT